VSFPAIGWHDEKDKKYPENVAQFLEGKYDHLPSRFVTHFTTISPHKNHVLHTTFFKTPLKNKGKSKISLPSARRIFSDKNRRSRVDRRGRDR
jgi:hypothetical protein